MAIDIDESKVQQNWFLLWVAWSLATAVGMILGHLPLALIITDLDTGLARVAVPLLTGLFTGLAQWLVLRRYVTRSHDWILNLAGGWVVGYAIGLFVAQSLARSPLGPLGSLVGFLLFGVIVAVFQWPVLRREIPHITPWILANMLGWALGAYLSGLISGGLFAARPPSLSVSVLVVDGLTGLIAGAVVGLALIWIVRKPERADLASQ
jgi:hypothetical protein